VTDAQIRTAIRSGWPFFGVTSRGEIMARYALAGPVFCWKKNQMIPTPLQGSDLLWWLQASDEEDHADPAAP
jgi:hypothetical protein